MEGEEQNVPFSVKLRTWLRGRRHKEGANVLGISLDTFRNWHQGRNEPDRWRRPEIERLMEENK